MGRSDMTERAKSWREAPERRENKKKSARLRGRSECRSLRDAPGICFCIKFL